MPANDLVPDVPPPKMADGPSEKKTDAKRSVGRPKGAKTKQPKADTAPKPSSKPTSRQAMRDGIAGLYKTAGLGFGVVPNLLPIGKECIVNAEEIADAWMEACDQSPAIRKFWEQALTTSAYSKLLMAHAPIAVAAFGPRLSSVLGGGGGGSSEGPKKGRGPTPSTSPPPPSSSVNVPNDLSDFNPAFGDVPVDGQ